MKYLSTFLLICLCTFSCQTSTDNQETDSSQEMPTTNYERIVSLSGSITETLFAMGHGDKVVAVDVTSTYPAEALAEVPRLGHVRQLNIEGVMSQQPDLIILLKENEALPAVQQLKESGVELLIVDSEDKYEAPIEIAKVLSEKIGGSQEKVAELEQRLMAQKSELEALVGENPNRPKVLFIYARGTNNMMVAGTGTPAEEMIQMAGGQNAITEFEGFKALSAEGLIQAQPDYILMFESGLQSVGGTEPLMEVEGIQKTPAGQAQRIITMDGLKLLGFTPRIGDAALELAKKLKE
ncbi:MAG: helical backbone metal receptor [Bacteroidota bacterium]